MSDRDAWLALTTEQAIEPDLAICDPHHHLWDYPGSRYLLDEFLRDIGGGHRVLSTVFVECRQFYRADGPREMRPVGETEFVDGVAGGAKTGSGTTEVAAGIVGFADLTLGSAVKPVLEAHMEASSRLRGVRHASAWDESDKVHNAHTKPPRGLLGDQAFRDGFECLGKFGLSFDAWLYQNQLTELADLANAFPDTPIVLNHMAGPLGIGPYAGRRDEVFSEWRSNMAGLARCENVTVKLGGRAMTMSGFGWHKREAPPGSVEMAEAMRPYFEVCIESFNADRCMFESNFPVDKASCNYTVLWNAFKRASREYSKSERTALFHDTAVRFYRLESTLSCL
jgi:predicted TIM-barrel fold metal-dependent hydrolase